MSNSPASPEDAELRERISKDMGWWSPPGMHSASGFDAYPERTDIVVMLISTEKEKQASRIRAEVLDLVEREVIGEDEPNFYGGLNYSLTKEHRNGLRRIERKKLAALRQKPGEEGT